MSSDSSTLLDWVSKVIDPVHFQDKAFEQQHTADVREMSLDDYTILEQQNIYFSDSLQTSLENSNMSKSIIETGWTSQIRLNFEAKKLA